MLKRFPGLVSMMFETLETNDYAVLGTGMETLGFIATSLKGKYMLQSLGNITFTNVLGCLSLISSRLLILACNEILGARLPETLRRMVEKLPCLPMDVKVRLLNSIANILQLNVSQKH